MNQFIKRTRLIIILALAFMISLSGQDRKGGDKAGDKEKIIKDVENGIVQNDVKSFSRYFDKNIYITLRDGETGYFSANQAVYLLQNYFESHRFLRFTFSTINITGIPIYATGGGTYMSKGSQENVQIYITVTQNKGGYVITQFCLY